MLDDLFEEAKKVAAQKNAEVIVHVLYVLDVCKKGEGLEQCRFLSELDSGNHVCLKLTNYKDTINAGVQEWKRQISPHDFHYDPPIGDNCPGKKL